jgi:hypothetical protein
VLRRARLVQWREVEEVSLQDCEILQQGVPV